MAQPTAKTTLDLAAAVLREIRVLRPDEDPSAEDRTTIEDLYAGIFQELAVLGLAYWPAEAIPVLVFRPLVKLVASEAAPGWNKPYEAPDAMQRMRIACSIPWDGEETPKDYF